MNHWSNDFNTYAEAKASLDLDPDNYICQKCGNRYAHVEYGCECDTKEQPMDSVAKLNEMQSEIEAAYTKYRMAERIETAIYDMWLNEVDELDKDELYIQWEAALRRTAEAYQEYERLKMVAYE